MCFEWFCFIQSAIDSPPAMCPTCVWRCGDIVLVFHPGLCRLHAHHCGHNIGIIAEVEHSEISVCLRSHTLCAANAHAQRTGCEHRERPGPLKLKLCVRFWSSYRTSKSALHWRRVRVARDSNIRLA